MQNTVKAETITAAELSQMLDHTLLKPEATRAQVERLCDEAAEHRFACAMVNPCWVSLAAQQLGGTGVPVGVVIGFPLGATLRETKLAEAASVLSAGAHDVDTVMNIGFLKSGMRAEVRDEIAALASLVHEHGGILKVILETALLTEDEKAAASSLAVEADADFIKTSTGFSSGGATVADVQRMRSIAGDRCGVKASGGIRTLSDALAMIDAGASRIGTSASVAIVNELRGGAPLTGRGY